MNEIIEQSKNDEATPVSLMDIPNGVHVGPDFRNNTVKLLVKDDIGTKTVYLKIDGARSLALTLRQLANQVEQARRR